MFPDFLPPAVNSLTEVPSIALAQQMRRVSLQTDLSDRPLPTSYVCQGQGSPPLLLLHGFDSSVLEFRRLLPRLAAHRVTWAVDLLGFGFSDRTLSQGITPDAIKRHLHHFWQQQIRQPMVLIGASMGGAAALDFTLSYPETVRQLVLLDSAGLAAGPAMERFMFAPFDRWATAFLKNPGVRRRISLQAYYDKQLVTPDAELCASLHLGDPSWSKALIGFTKTGGYNFLSDQISGISLPTLIIWGRQDKILGTRDATQFASQLPKVTLVWIENCGHVPHLESPEETANAISAWLDNSIG